MNSLRYLANVTRTAGARRMGTQAQFADKNFKKFKETQDRFQIPDGQLIHVKGGPLDKSLFVVTSVLTAIGVAMSFQFYIKMSFPKKE